MSLMTQPGAKRPTNLTLDEDLVREARTYTPNLSATLERLLGDYVATERRRHRDVDAALDRLISAVDAMHDATGLLSDEFSGL